MGMRRKAEAMWGRAAVWSRVLKVNTFLLWRLERANSPWWKSRWSYGCQYLVLLRTRRIWFVEGPAKHEEHTFFHGSDRLLTWKKKKPRTNKQAHSASSSYQIKRRLFGHHFSLCCHLQFSWQQCLLMVLHFPLNNSLGGSHSQPAATYCI